MTDGRDLGKAALPVNRCICHALPFEHLERLAREERLDFVGLRARTGCCTGCASCEPYVRLMLKTGRTRFAVLCPEEVARIMEGTRE